MGKKRDKKLFEKYFQPGACIKSPEDKRDYTCKQVMIAAMPIPEEYRVSGMAVLNQGSVGSCVAHACATAMGYGELKGGRPAHNFSRGFIYGNRRPLDFQGEGMFTRQALKQLNHCGDCEYIDFPYNETYPSVKARIEKDKDNLLKKAEPFKILNYFRCYSNDEVKTTLMNQGAVIICVPVYESFAAECPLPKRGEKNRGGHAMCIIGWDKTGWIVQNSWSKAWGKKGCLHLPYEYPVDEFWGITVNPSVPTPTKPSFIKRVASFFKFLIGRIINFFKFN